MMKIYERFLKYVMEDTQSSAKTGTMPSTPGQLGFAQKLYAELKGMGIEDVRLDGQGYILGSIPSNIDREVPVIGFIAHIDTAEVCPPPSKAPRVIRDYDGQKITLESGVILDPSAEPALAACKGQDIIVTDGYSLLGGDDKAGVAAIVTAMEELTLNPALKHGKVAFSFTPDEEIGCSQDHFDVEAFGADFAYTVDGGSFGEIEYENFNAASAEITVKGVTTHPGEAKDKMKNAALIAMEFNTLLPPWERPEHTSDYEGFFHLIGMSGDCGQSRLFYIIREHDAERFAARKELVLQAVQLLNARYGEGTAAVEIRDGYRNMSELIRPHMHLINYAREEICALGCEPVTNPIRGGTDGCRLTYKGIPCPNLGTGSFNHHSVCEVASIDQMELSKELILRLAERYGKGV